MTEVRKTWIMLFVAFALVLVGIVAAWNRAASAESVDLTGLPKNGAIPYHYGLTQDEIAANKVDLTGLPKSGAIPYHYGLTQDEIAANKAASSDDSNKYVQCHGSMGYCSFVE